MNAAIEHRGSALRHLDRLYARRCRREATDGSVGEQLHERGERPQLQNVDGPARALLLGLHSEREVLLGGAHGERPELIHHRFDDDLAGGQIGNRLHRDARGLLLEGAEALEGPVLSSASESAMRMLA